MTHGETRPRVVLFDMDGVLCRYDFPRRLASLSAMTGLPAETIEEIIWRRGFDEEGDQGRYTATEYHRLFCERLGVELTREQWARARADAMTPREEVLAMARAVKRRCVVAMLTNNGPLLRETIAGVFPPVPEIFGERAFFSCDLGAAKPSPAVFAAVLARLDAGADETLFIDDEAGYVAGAAEAGLRTHHFRSAAALRETLADLRLLP